MAKASSAKDTLVSPVTVTFERGFKSWSENIAGTLREKLGVHRVAPLPPPTLAEHLGAIVCTPEIVPDLDPFTISYLTSPEGDEWSAVTIRVEEVDVIVLNPSHSPARQYSDLMHELAHLLRRHEPAQIVMSADMMVGLRSFNAVQEAEANWLAGTLLLPRDALAFCANRGLGRDDIAERYGVSSELVRYRMNVTGVGKQFKAYN